MGASTEPPTGRGRARDALGSFGRYGFATDTSFARTGAGYFSWLDHVWPAAGCTGPIRLHGRVHHVDTVTGQVVAVETESMPDGVIYTPCGNRRAAICRSCAETYRRDAFELVRAGLAGGKGISHQVARHPAIFVTFTAPSFGPVHARVVRRHTCTNRLRCVCRAEPCHARTPRPSCPHGRPLACFARHSVDDEMLGQPLCLDCYDYPAHAIWNAHAAELWRRTKQHAERHLNQLARTRGLGPVRLRHGKAAEFQARGAVHFHVLFRLDGHDPSDPETLLPSPGGLTTTDLEAAIRDAAAAVSHTTAPHPDNPAGWHITWGRQLDTRPITRDSRNEISAHAVAAYLAKYATKSTEITGHISRRITPDTLDMYANPHGTHTERLIAACWALGTTPDYRSLRRWAHMLGFGGHFLTKGRRYSITFRLLRTIRIIYRRAHTTAPNYSSITTGDIDLHEQQATVVITQLAYAGTGWETTGDALLANSAAARARERQQAGREDLIHQHAERVQTIAA